MRYFQALPNILNTDYNGNQVVVKNLITKAVLTDTLLYDPLIFYQYDIQDQDTPESIANKYYGDPYRFWLVLLPNQILDPQWGWPMSQKLFGDYLNDKYSALAAANNQTVQAYTQGTIQNYIKQIQTTDNLSQNTTIRTYTLDANAYANTFPGSPQTIGSGAYSVTITTTKYTQYILDYELQQNEAKRTIYIINSSYVTSLESQFSQLMSQ
jgi:Base plate wedge protein 53